jgi:glycosyltransferase involved in cell wall biosynthesis
MDIFLICHVYPPEHAPAGVMIRELAEDLGARGHRVTVITGWPNHPDGVLQPGWKARWRELGRENGYRVLRCGHVIHPRTGIFWRMAYYLSFAVGSLINGLAAGRCDAVLCLSTPVFGSWTAWLLARLKGARFLYTIFDLHPEAARNAGMLAEGRLYHFLRTGDTALCWRSDAIVTLSEEMKRQIVDRGVDPPGVHVVPFWMDENRIRPSHRRNAWRRSQGIPDEAFVALYAGTIGFISGAGILADAAEILADREDILILIVGEGPVKESLAAERDRRGLQNILLLPFQPEEHLNDVQATGDVGLVSLLPEAGQTSVPSKVLGYMAAGRPIVASVAEDSPTGEMIRLADCGLVTAPCAAAGLAAAIKKLADDRAAADQMGENGRRYLVSHYGRSACVDRYERIVSGPA